MSPATKSQIATAAKRRLIPLLISAPLFTCVFFFNAVFQTVVTGVAVAFLLVVSECVAWKICQSEGRIGSKDKAVLVTGCDTGFGHEVTIRLASGGFKVFAGCLKPFEEGWNALSSIPNVHCLRMDISKEEEVELALAELSEHLKGNDLWAVINNAGISKGSDVELTPMSKIEEVLDVNLLGTIRVTKAVLPLIRKSKGRIINVASIAGTLMMPGYVPYSVSKAALIAFSKGLRMELQKFGVSVVCIEPWIYKTRLSDPSRIVDPSQPGSQARDSRRSTRRVFSGLRNPNLGEVIDVMEDAVTRVPFPHVRYRPGKWYLNAVMWVASWIPEPWVDYVISNWVFTSHAAK